MEDVLTLPQVYFWTIYSVPLILMSVIFPSPHTVMNEAE